VASAAHNEIVTDDGMLHFYQEWVERRSTSRVQELGIIYGALGLAGECGEVIEKIKKIVRDKDGVTDHADVDYLKLELGDVMWYVTKIANELGLSLQNIILANIDKIEERRFYGKR